LIFHKQACSIILQACRVIMLLAWSVFRLAYWLCAQQFHYAKNKLTDEGMSGLIFKIKARKGIENPCSLN